MKALVILANGFEEIESFAVVDILRRAKIDVTVAGLISTIVESSHAVRVMADKRLGDINTNDYDILILPGGNPGYKNLANSQIVINLVKNFEKKKKLIAAICGAPSVLAKAGIMEDRIGTIATGLEKELPRVRDAKVIVDKNVITSKGPGTAIEFALKIVEIISGKGVEKKLREQMAVD
ncbi:MAG: DJ-1 family glyoxalase III [Candidatus Aenigmatarchaeota archaeon]